MKENSAFACGDETLLRERVGLATNAGAVRMPVYAYSAAELWVRAIACCPLLKPARCWP